jgi:hypothetical protein
VNEYVLHLDLQETQLPLLLQRQKQMTRRNHFALRSDFRAARGAAGTSSHPATREKA